METIPFHGAQSSGSRRASPSPEQLKLRRAAQKREIAAKFLNKLVSPSHLVPHDTDESFRKSLADGTLLCNALNALRPGTIPHVVQGDESTATPTGEIRQLRENIANFLDAVTSFTTETFSAADLEASGEKYVLGMFSAKCMSRYTY